MITTSIPSAGRHRKPHRRGENVRARTRCRGSNNNTHSTFSCGRNGRNFRKPAMAALPATAHNRRRNALERSVGEDD